MGKKYYCDYCDKSFADNPTNRKNHARGVHHRQARSAHYEHFKGNSCASVLSLFHVYTRDIVLNLSICLSVTLLPVKLSCVMNMYNVIFGTGDRDVLWRP